MYDFMQASAHSCNVDALRECCSPQNFSLRASVQFEVDQGVSRRHAAQAAASVHCAVMGGIYY